MAPPSRLVLLVSLSAGYSPEAIPLGAACLASALGAHGPFAELWSVSLLEARLDEGARELASRIAAAGPMAVGFSLFCWNRGRLTEAARFLEAAEPDILLFAGGPEVTADPETLAAEGPWKLLVAGEGEGAVQELTEAFAAWSEGPSPRWPEARILRSGECDPASLPSPWLDGTLRPLARGAVLWELERGCPYACSFCFESKGSRRLRRFDRGRIEKELELFARSGVAEIVVLSPTFNADRARALELLSLFKRKGRGLGFSLEIRAESIDAELARAFAAIGAKLQVGLQSARPEVCARVGRTLDPAAFARKTALLDREGLVWGLDLIYGLPGDDLPGFRLSLDWALALRPNHLDVFRLSVLPGTRLRDQAAAEGLSWEGEPPYRLLSSPLFPPEDLDEAEELAKAAEILYNRGRSVAWFHPFCRALGMKPSALLSRAASMLAARPDRAELEAIGESGEFDAAAIMGFQLELARELCRGKRERLLPLALDVIGLHGAYGRAVAEGASMELELSYDPDESLSSAADDMAAFVSRIAPSPRRVRVFPDGRGDAGIEEV